MVDAHNSLSRTSVTAVHLVRVSRARGGAGGAEAAATAECLLTLRVVDGSSSGAHKFKVLGLLFAQLRENMWQPPGTHVDPARMFDLAPGSAACPPGTSTA